MKDLKEKTIRGGVARLGAQGANFALRIVSLMVLARLLDPKDFGLVGMVTAFTGVLTLFRDFGLSSAAIQRSSVSEEQISTLFWINLAVGAVLGGLAVVLAPVVAMFYHEPRLTTVTMALAAGFLFNAAGVQHGALLQREMRFTALAVINTVGLFVGSAIGICGALAGYGYWSLVAMTITSPLVSSIGFWVATGWIPGRPRRDVEIHSLMRFGGTITLNGLVAYVAYNLEKVMLGRYWGADAIGLYGRAYQLSNIPTDNLNGAVGEVAFSALSRLQDDPGRMKSYFLKGYSLVVAMTIPITLGCAIFANDIILAFLGPKWGGASEIFRLLSPTMLIFAIVNPLGWLLYSLGMVNRSLKMALVFAPTIILGCFIGLPYGPRGVAFAYSSVMALWVIPFIVWAVHGTIVRVRDVISAVSRPFASGVVAGGITYVLAISFGQLLPPLPKAILEIGVLLAVYLGILLLVTGQASVYMDVLRGLKWSASIKGEEPASA